MATASQKNAPNPLRIFDKSAKVLQKSRAARDPLASRKADYLRDEMAVRTIERLAFITRDFSRLLDLGAGLGPLLRHMCTESKPLSSDEQEIAMVKQLNEDKKKVREKIKDLVMVDSSEPLLYRDADQPLDHTFPGSVTRVVGDEEGFDVECLQEQSSYDAVVSNLSMHWINDLPAALQRISGLLKPDGLFMGTLFGGDTLFELRTSLQLAELERRGGMSPRVSPLVHINDVGLLLNRAGFSMLTIDSEDVVVGGYPDIVALLSDLQAMGEQNALISRATTLPREVLLAANEIYKALHGEADENGVVTLPATFSVISMIGWKKDASQPQPLARGSAQVNLKDVL